MQQGRFRDVLYFTIAWGVFAVIAIAAQPGPLMHGMPSLVKPAQAGETPVAGKETGPVRLALATVVESAE